MPTTGVDINHNNLHISNHTLAGHNSKAMDISNHSSSSNTISNITVVNSMVVKDSKTKWRRWSRNSCPESSTSFYACSVIDFEDVQSRNLYRFRGILHLASSSTSKLFEWSTQLWSR